MYQFGEIVNNGLFFRFDKWWISNMNWALLPKSSKSVLPVIACHCNSCGESFPGEETIAALSGLTPKTVREGIKNLEGFPGFELSHYTTRRGRRAKRYHVTFPLEDEEGRSFFFHRIIIDGGNWRELKPVSQALYPVMRYFGYFDAELYVEEEDDDALLDMEVPELYKIRKWDLCEAEIVLMAKYAGIDRRSFYAALANLEKNYLIENAGVNDAGDRRWRVYLRPPRYWKRAYLNKKIITQAQDGV